MAHMTSGFYRDRLGFDPEKEVMASTQSSTRRTVAAYSSSSLSRQEISTGSTMARESYQTSSSTSRGHYAVSSHVGNGSLGDHQNGGGHYGGGDRGGGSGGMIQQHGQYEQNLEKFKGEHKKNHGVKSDYVLLDR